MEKITWDSLEKLENGASAPLGKYVVISDADLVFFNAIPKIVTWKNKDGGQMEAKMTVANYKKNVGSPDYRVTDSNGKSVNIPAQKLFEGLINQAIECEVNYFTSSDIVCR